MNALRIISAYVLAFLVLMSSTSFMVGFHYCQGKVKNVSLFKKADECAAKKAALPLCHRHKKSSCCKDETLVHEGSDFKASAGHFEFAPALYVVQAALPSFIREITPAGAEDGDISYVTYDPPLPLHDQQASLQVFLI